MITKLLAESQPRPGVTYRCSVCRLELVFDPDVERMVPAPMSELPTDDDRSR